MRPTILPCPLFLLALFVAAGCGGALGGGGGGSGDPLSPRDDPPELVLCRSRIGTTSDAQIRTASATGLGEGRVLDRPGVERDVRIAPDGNQLVFVRERRSNAPDSREVFVGSYDGSVAELRLTVDTTVDDAPAWSPDGERIVFVSHRLGSGGRLFVMRGDGSDAVPLYDDGAEQSAPDWSWVDGRIAFARLDATTGSSQIWIVDADGRVAAPVTDGGAAAGIGGGDHDPAWSPDGASIVFTRDVPTGGRALAVVDVRSGVVDVLTPADGRAQQPRWSAHGDRIFFAADRPAAGIDGLRLWTVRPDGAGRFLVFGDIRYEFLGVDVLPGIRAAPAIDTEIADADLGSATIISGLGRPSRGNADFLLQEDGASFGLTTVESNQREIAGLEIDVPLPLARPRDALALEITVVAALTEPTPDSIIRLTIRNYEAGRGDIVIERTPTDSGFVTVAFAVANLQHVSTDSRTRIGIIAENPFDNRTELLIDAVRVRVHRPAAAR